MSALGRSALVAAPNATDGGHCMLAVGYDAEQRMFRVRNSWGHNWADAGHCWIPFSYFLSDPDFDVWTSVCDKVSGELSRLCRIFVVEAHPQNRLRALVEA